MNEEIPRERLEQYFARYGWSCDAVDERTLRTGFRGKNSNFTALVRSTGHWVIFSINPYLRPPESGWGVVTLRAMASANLSAHLVKFGLDGDDDAFLTVELPSEGFSYSQFEEAIGALSNAADNFLVPMLQAQAVDVRNG
ncbi:MAG: YbjN domain-containing protein [Myxococcota bacterium]